MKAAVYTQYGPPSVLRIVDIPRPEPQVGEVLVRIYASTVNRTDAGFRSAEYFITRFFTGLRKPKRSVAGSEFAGEVVQVGPGVDEFSVGDRVFGFEDVRSGAHAEYMVSAASGSITHIPDGLSFFEAVPAGEGATYAHAYIASSDVQSGDRALVYGASGAIGSAAVQMLVHMGVRVTAVCGTKSVELIKKLGPERVIDYQTDDFTAIDDRFELVFDAVGKSSYGVCKKLLAPGGAYCSTELGRGIQNPLLALWFAITRSRRVLFPFPRINKHTIELVRNLLAEGALRPVIDTTYPLEEIADASAYVETGEKIGAVVITVVDDLPQ